MSARVTLTILLIAAPVLAQDLVPADRPAPAAAEKDRNEAARLHALGTLRKNQGRYLDAIAAFEGCLKLDADAVAPRKLLAAAYRVVGRLDDAVAQSKKVTDLAPADFDGWQRYADLLKELGRAKDAAAALDAATRCATAADQPEQQFLALQRLTAWYEKQADASGVESASRRLLAVLEKNKTAFRASGFLSDAEYEYETADVHERMGRAYLKAGAADAALAAFAAAQRTFLARDDEAARARVFRLHLHLAEVNAARNETADALDHLQKYLQAKPQSLEPFKLYATLMDRAGRQGEKLRGLAAYADRDKANLPLQLFLADQYAEANQFDEAQKIYLAQAKDHPKPEVYKGLLKLYFRNRRMELAVQRLDEQLNAIEDKGKSEDERETAGRHAKAIYAALRSDPALLRAAVPKAQDEWLNQIQNKNNLNNYKTFYILAQFCATTGDLAAAEQVLVAARGRVQFPGFLAGIDESYIQVLRAQRKYQAVVNLCNTQLHVRTRNDNRFMYNYYKIVPHLRLGQIEDAKATAEQAVLVAHSEGAKFIATAQKIAVLSWNGEHAAAVEAAEALPKEFTGPEFARRIKLTQATTYAEARNYARAEKLLRIVLDADPNDATACNALGYQLADQNRHLDEAERLIRRAIDLDRAERQRGSSNNDDEDEEASSEQENAAYLDSLGWVLFRKGKYAEARAWIEKAVALPAGKEDPTTWDHLGDIHYRAGDVTKAHAAWKNAAAHYEQDYRSKKDGRAEELRRKLTRAD